MIPLNYSQELAPVGDDLTGTLIIALIIIITLLAGILANRRVERRRQERLRHLRQQNWMARRTAHVSRIRGQAAYKARHRKETAK